MAQQIKLNKIILKCLCRGSPNVYAHLLEKYAFPNYIIFLLILANGSAIFESQKAEKILRPEDISPGDNVVPPFNAYAAPGDVTSQRLFYVNYGREEDFYWLKNNKSVNFNDSVVIARYGKIFRGDKVFL